MQIQVNGQNIHITNSKVSDNFDKNSVVIIDGFAVDCDYNLTQGQQLIVIKKGELPSQEVLELMLQARNGIGVQEKLKKSCVAIIGLGGLGSNIVVMLARLGIGKLICIDFDVVEPSNLNRQHYFIQNLGEKKTQAIKQIIKQINPYVQVETINEKIDADNIMDSIKGCKIVCEAVDNAQSKAEIVNTILQNDPSIYVVASSGMAGAFSSNTIKTTHKMSKLYICGDEQNEAKIGNGLMSPRVSICAGHQANMILRLILGYTEV